MAMDAKILFGIRLRLMAGAAKHLTLRKLRFAHGLRP